MGKTFSGDGLNPCWYRVSTFFFFLVQGVLLFFFFRKILDSLATPTHRDWVAFAATALYMVHPMQAETINYIIARSDSLSTCFLLMAFVAYPYSERRGDTICIYFR
jgi:hypothetical protein